MEESKPVTLKQLIKRGLSIYFCTVIYVISFVYIFGGLTRENILYLEILSVMLGAFAVMLVAIGLFVYSNRNSSLFLHLNSPNSTINDYLSIYVIVFGLGLIISNFSLILPDTKTILIRGIFGIIIIISGYLRLRKSKNLDRIKEKLLFMAGME